jgi:hypothetical protein
VSDVAPALVTVAVILVGVVAVGWMLVGAGGLIRSSPEAFDVGLPEPERADADLPGLRGIDVAVRMAIANAFGVETMLRPRLRELTAWRLLRQRGIDIEAEPDRARALVGETLWMLIDNTAPRSSNNAPGIALGDLQAAVEHLAQI